MINNIQLLRAFAAINVVCFHIISISGNLGNSPETLSIFKGWGANGVDIFFVIYGFIMVYIQLKKKMSVGYFIRSRIIRIVPIYWLFISIGVIIYSFYGGTAVSKDITFEWVISSYLFVSQPIVGTPPIANVGWTLEWEMLFYLIFSASFLLKDWRAVLACVGLTLIIISILAKNWIAMEFLFGMAIAYTYHFKKHIKINGNLILVIGMSLLLLSLNDNIKAYQIDRVILWGIPSIFIVMGALYAKQTSNRFANYLGDASYSIYLSHPIGIYAFYKISSKIPLPLNNDFLAMLCLAACVFGGCLIHSFIEKPVTNILNKKYRAPVVT